MVGTRIAAIGGVVATLWATGLDLPAQRRGGRGNSTASALAKHEVRDAKKRQAVCNDGSPAAYFFKAGADPDRHKWVIFFQGGGGCGSDASCADRFRDQHNLMTSVGLSSRETPDGLLSDDPKVNPDFARYNHVIAHYCSSDAYAGDGTRTIDGRAFEFRGHRIVDGVIDDLMDKAVVGSPALGEATDVLIAGSSAGGMCVQNNLDRLAERLTFAKVKGLADSGWAPDVKPFGPGNMLRPDSEAAYVYDHSIPDASCAAANPGHEGKCLYGSFVARYITTPIFFYVDQRDPSHLGTFGAAGRGGADQQAYVQRYMQATRDSLKDVPAVFSPVLGAHMALQNERFNSAVIDGHSFAETFGAWYFGRSGPVKLIAAETGRRGR